MRVCHTEEMSKEVPGLTTELRTAVSRPAAIDVRVLTGAEAGIDHEGGAVVVIGRAARVSLRLSSTAVSLYHVELEGTADGILVRDLGSSNGTLVGGLDIQRARIPSGSTIVLGDVTLEVRTAARKVRSARADRFGSLVGLEPVMRDLFARCERLAPTDLSLLVEGPAGAGKSALVRAIHAASARATTPLVEVACGGIPAVMAMDAFDGDEGFLASARGGTLLLDNIDALARNAQLWLGERLASGFTGRVFATTRQDLHRLVNRGVFAANLHAVLAGAVLRVPALEEHSEDIPFLVQAFLGELPPETASARGISTEALAELAARKYHDDVRELRRVVERLSKLASSAVIELADLAFERSLDRAGSDEPLLPFKDAKRNAVDGFEREYLERLLDRVGANVSHAAAHAGIDRHSLRALLRRHNLRDD